MIETRVGTGSSMMRAFMQWQASVLRLPNAANRCLCPAVSAGSDTQGLEVIATSKHVSQAAMRCRWLLVLCQCLRPCVVCVQTSVVANFGGRKTEKRSQASRGVFADYTEASVPPNAGPLSFGAPMTLEGQK